MSDTSPVRRIGLVPASLIIGISFVAATIVAANTLMETKISSKSIHVKGYAEKQITSDFAVWKGQLTARASKISDAYSSMEKDMDRFLLYLEREGVSNAPMELSPVTIDVRFKQTDKGVDTTMIESYVLEQTVSVSLKDIRKIQALARDSSQLVKDGMEFKSFPPDYYYTELEGMKIQMLGEATKDALQRAAIIASNGGVTIGRLRSAQQGVFQVTPVYSTDVSGGGILDTTSIEKTIKAVVDSEFALK